MKKMLYDLFDFQKFSGNERLAKLIANTEGCYGKTLSDDELEGLNAAGEPFAQLICGTSEDKHDD